MFSHALVSYQQAVMQFFVKTTDTFKATSKSLALEPHYNFSILKELTQSEKQENSSDNLDGILDLNTIESKIDSDKMLFFQDEFKDETPLEQNKSTADMKIECTDVMKNDVNLIDIPNMSLKTETNEAENLLDNITDLVLNPPLSTGNTDLLGLHADISFGDFMSAEASAFMPSQLLLNDLDNFNLNTSNYINQPIPNEIKPNEIDNLSSENISKSSILDLFNKIPKLSQNQDNKIDLHNESNTNIPKYNASDSKMTKTPKTNKDKLSRKDMSAWFHLFAELDPLSNPDAIDSKLDGNFANNSHAA